MIEAKTVEFVECEICMRRVHKSQAHSVELDDQFVYFCGSDCREVWEDEQRLERTQEAGEP